MKEKHTWRDFKNKFSWCNPRNLSLPHDDDVIIHDPEKHQFWKEKQPQEVFEVSSEPYYEKDKHLPSPHFPTQPKTEEGVLTLWRLTQVEKEQRGRENKVAEAHSILLGNKLVRSLSPTPEVLPSQELREKLSKLGMKQVDEELTLLNQEIHAGENFKDKKLADVEYYLDVRFPSRHNPGFTRHDDVEEIREQKLRGFDDDVKTIQDALVILQEIHTLYMQRKTELEALASETNKQALILKMEQAVKDVVKVHKKLVESIKHRNKLKESVTLLHEHDRLSGQFHEAKHELEQLGKIINIRFPECPSVPEPVAMVYRGLHGMDLERYAMQKKRFWERR